MRKYRFVALVVLFGGMIVLGAREFGVEADSTPHSTEAAAGTWAVDLGERYLYDHRADKSGGFVGVGSHSDSYSDSRDGWLVRVDANGNMTTQKGLGGPNGDFLYCVAPTSDGGWIAGGGTESYGSQHWEGDAWICKLDSSLKVQWQRIYRSSDKYRDDSVWGILQSSDGNIVALMFDNYPYMMKLDSAGNVLWYKSYADSYAYDMGYESSRLVETADRGIAMIGNTSIHGGDGFLFKVDQNGDLLWKRWIEGRATGDEDEMLDALTATSDGGVVVGGYTDSYGDTADGWLLKFDANGSLVWQYRYKGSDSWRFASAEELADGTIVLAGTAAPYYFSDDDLRLVKVANNGKLVWYKRYDQFDYHPRLSVTSDGRLGISDAEDHDLLSFSSAGEMTSACKPVKWKLKTYKTTAAISEPDITVTDLTMKRLNMNAKMYDTKETVTSVCR